MRQSCVLSIVVLIRAYAAIAQPIPPPVPDMNGSGFVDLPDVGLFWIAFGSVGIPGAIPGDFDLNGIVNLGDYAIFHDYYTLPSCVPANCEDGDLCTFDHCITIIGQCVHFNIPDCCTDAAIHCVDGNVCTEDVCTDSRCSNPPLECKPTDCDDERPCTLDNCVCGSCAHLEVPGCCDDNANCDDGVDCTRDVCDGDHRCSWTPDDALCDDGAFCNGEEYCDMSIGCWPGPPPDCNDGLGCSRDTCDSDLNRCIHLPANCLHDILGAYVFELAAEHYQCGQLNWPPVLNKFGTIGVKSYTPSICFLSQSYYKVGYAPWCFPGDGGHVGFISYSYTLASVPSISDSGTLAYVGKKFVGNYDLSVYTPLPGFEDQPVVILEDTLTKTGVGYGNFGPPGIDDAGQVTVWGNYRAEASGPYDLRLLRVPSTGGSLIVLFSAKNGPFPAEAHHDDPDYTFVAGGGDYSQAPPLNRFGTVAFWGSVTHRTDDVTETTKYIFVTDGGTSFAVADTSGIFAAFGPLAINDAGTVAFVASVDSGQTGVFLSGGGVVAMSGGVFTSFNSVSINNIGQTAFGARLSSGANGIFLGPDPIGDKVIATGDVMHLTHCCNCPGEIPQCTVGSISPLSPKALNDSGQIAFIIRFTPPYCKDNRTIPIVIEGGVFRATLLDLYP